MDEKKIKSLVSQFCLENDLTVQLSYDMPNGYETAFGTYDVTINTLFLNRAMLQNAPEYEILFYLYHELRHAMQYLRPELFSTQIRESKAYVILYNGTCFKLANQVWMECTIEGDEGYFTDAYMSLPYELDANNFAYEKVKVLCGDCPELHALYCAWMPEKRRDYNELRHLFRIVDEKLNG